MPNGEPSGETSGEARGKPALNEKPVANREPNGKRVLCGEEFECQEPPEASSIVSVDADADSDTDAFAVLLEFRQNNTKNLRHLNIFRLSTRNRLLSLSLSLSLSLPEIILAILLQPTASDLLAFRSSKMRNEEDSSSFD